MNFIKEEFKKNKKNYELILKKIKKYDTIVVFRHIMPDYDALGSQFGLAEWLKDNFKNKKILVAGDNHITFTGVLFPEVDNISNEDLNTKFLGIILDVGDEGRIADPRFKQADSLIKIDHHPHDAEIAPISICETDKSSCSEIVAGMLHYFEKKSYKFNVNSANYLYIGLVGDSGRFLYNSTSPYTFEISAVMQDKGLNLTKLYNAMYTKDIKELDFIKFVIANYKLTKKGVCYYVLNQKDLTKLGISCEEGKVYVNFFSNYYGIKIWCSITEDVTEPCYRISLRSRDYVINEVAKKYKGGGHKQAAGCQITDLTELPQFVKDLEAVIDEQDKKE